MKALVAVIKRQARIIRDLEQQLAASRAECRDFMRLADHYANTRKDDAA